MANIFSVCFLWGFDAYGDGGDEKTIMILRMYGIGATNGHSDGQNYIHWLIYWSMDGSMDEAMEQWIDRWIEGVAGTEGWKRNVFSFQACFKKKHMSMTAQVMIMMKAAMKTTIVMKTMMLLMVAAIMSWMRIVDGTNDNDDGNAAGDNK